MSDNHGKIQQAALPLPDTQLLQSKQLQQELQPQPEQQLTHHHRQQLQFQHQQLAQMQQFQLLQLQQQYHQQCHHSQQQLHQVCQQVSHPSDPSSFDLNGNASASQQQGISPLSNQL
ncbi:G-box-binding factor-like [Schistocerca piceifrons]|uniref:G-box-binding factor-like n=1 Tax=Schistocerca piceifrons TaxID=274613 RepID=UPI001F5E78BD|nr:G-box-binding factor-like [Schistocerca piceifrons]